MIYTEDFFASGSAFPNDSLVQLVDSFTDENVNFKKINTWYDGTTMTPAKADGIIYRQKGSDYYADIDWLANRTVYVKRFGAKGDGINNDAPAIRRMISFLPPRDFIVVFENAKYMQGDGTFKERYRWGKDEKTKADIVIGDLNMGPEIFFSFTDKSDFIIYGNGAVIKAHPDNPPIINMRGFEFIRCKNFKIENLNYDGSKNDRKPDLGDPDQYNNQSGFKISSSQRYELLDCSSDNCCMDGFFISSDELFAIPKTNNWNEDGVLRNCHADNNYRQGSSIVNSKRFKVIGGSYTNTGKTYGTSPEAGIDIEEGNMSDFGRGSIDTVIDGVLFEDNNNAGLSLHLGTLGANVTNCTFKNNSLFTAPDPAALSCNNTIFNNNFYDSPAHLRAGGEHFYGNRFYLSPEYSFQFHVISENPHFKNKKCRETLVYNNYIHRDPGKKPFGQVAGSLTIGNYKDGVKVFNNIFVNLASKDNFLFIHGPQDKTLEFYDNTFQCTDEFIAHSPLTGLIYTNIERFFKNAYNNKMEIPGISPMVSTVKKAQADKLIRSFTLPDIPKNKFVDITFDNIGSSFEARDLYLKVTTKGYWYDMDSTQVKEEMISLSDVKPISYSGTSDEFKRLPVSTGIYIKNNKATLTFGQSSSDTANQKWSLDIVIEVLGGYTDNFPVTISDPYDTNTQPLIINPPITKSVSQNSSTANDIVDLRNDFNNLLSKLKNAGVMQN
nr:right-handed parallel beta-helix repeat-containing protein [uncultured Chryseobacterium sp.]